MKACTTFISENSEFQKKQIIVTEMKVGKRFVDTFTSRGFPMFEKNFEAYQSSILDTIKNFQSVTRTLHGLIAHGKRERDVNMIKESPQLKKVLELFLYKVKLLMKKKKILGALWMGTLKEKNLDGSEIADVKEELEGLEGLEGGLESDGESESESGCESDGVGGGDDDGDDDDDDDEDEDDDGV